MDGLVSSCNSLFCDMMHCLLLTLLYKIARKKEKFQLHFFPTVIRALMTQVCYTAGLSERNCTRNIFMIKTFAHLKVYKSRLKTMTLLHLCESRCFFSCIVEPPFFVFVTVGKFLIFSSCSFLGENKGNSFPKVAANY